MRHTNAGEPDVRGYAVTHPTGVVHLPRDPRWDQLIYAVRGVLTVHTATGTWVVPPHRAAWVPGGVTHRLALVGPTSLRTLYVAGSLAWLPAVCRVVDVTPLLRELLRHAVQNAPLYLSRPGDERLLGVLRDQLAVLPDAALQLPTPTDTRAMAVARALEHDPGDNRSVQVLAREAGASRRTLERAFLAETGMTVGQWRRRMRMLEALRLLATGLPATTVAMRVGYATPSSFGAAFKAELGGTPARWFAPTRD